MRTWNLFTSLYWCCGAEPLSARALGFTRTTTRPFGGYGYGYGYPGYGYGYGLGSALRHARRRRPSRGRAPSSATAS